MKTNIKTRKHSTQTDRKTDHKADHKAKSPTPKQTIKHKVVKNAAQNFGGKIQATEVYRRQMGEFKNCTAWCWLVVNAVSGQYWTANSYNGDVPPSSWKPSDYEYELTDRAMKLIAKKLGEQGYVQLEATDFPEWIENASRRTH